MCTGRVAADVCRVREDAGTTHDRVVYLAILVGMIEGVRPRDVVGHRRGPVRLVEVKSETPVHGREREGTNVVIEGGMKIGRGNFRGNVRGDSCVRAWALDCATAGRILRCTRSRRPRGGGSDLLVAQAKRI